MACLAMLSQSRGTALAMLGSLIVVVALVPGRTRRVYGLLVVAGAVAARRPRPAARLRPLAGRVGIRRRSATPPGARRCWPPIAAGARLGRCSRWRGSWLSPSRAWRSRAAQGRIVAARDSGRARAGRWPAAPRSRIEHDVRNQWHAFTHLADRRAPAPARSAASQSRLLSGGGNRYDYWRIAWRVWREHPLLGVGAGNYARSYYEQRATTEDIEQPHSIELQALSELGLVGALLLAGLHRRASAGGPCACAPPRHARR